MKIQYLIDDRRTGRTTEMLEEMLAFIREGGFPFYVGHNAQAVDRAVDWLHAHGIEKPWPMVGICTEYSLRNGHLRGREVDAVFIDNLDYMAMPLYEIIGAVQPIAKRIVVSLQGEVHKRKARMS